MNAPSSEHLETVSCHLCHSSANSFFINAEDDLTGKPGQFTFVTCDDCGFSFQNPRLKFEHIGPYYDDEYISHRQKTDWGWLTPFYERAMSKHDRDKLSLVQRYVDLRSGSKILDVGCGSGSFLSHTNHVTGAKASGVDFKDLSALPTMAGVDFHCGVLLEQTFPHAPFDLITMWHFLEHDYTALASLQRAKELLTKQGRLIIEVPNLDSVSFSLYKNRWPGLQAPQHTALFDRASLQRTVEQAGFKVVAHQSWGAFPPYFYLFAGAAFKLNKGKGLDLQRMILPYFLGQLLLFPILLFQRRMNLAMQTIVCAHI